MRSNGFLPRRFAFGAIALLLISLVTLVALEVTLHIAAPYLPDNISTVLLSRYTTEPDGMYWMDPETGFRMMRPNQQMRAHWAGHTWNHETDAWGFRNPPRKSKEILLLGDSLVYGHGVDEPGSFAGLLRDQYGHPVYNMARQADCLYENQISLLLWLDEFEPKRVFLFVFMNDLQDALSHLELGVEPRLLSPGRLHGLRRRTEELRGGPEAPSLQERLGMTYTVRLFRALWRGTRSAELFELFPASKDGAAAAPYYIGAVENDELYMVSSRYYRTVVGELADLLKQRGIALQLVDLDMRGGLPGYEMAADRMSLLVRTLCEENGLTCYSTRETLAHCEECFLPRDGHLSEEGNRRVAAMMDDILQGRAKPMTRPGLP